MFQQDFYLLACTSITAQTRLCCLWCFRSRVLRKVVLCGKNLKDLFTGSVPGAMLSSSLQKQHSRILIRILKQSLRVALCVTRYSLASPWLLARCWRSRGRLKISSQQQPCRQAQGSTLTQPWSLLMVAATKHKAISPPSNTPPGSKTGQPNAHRRHAAEQEVSRAAR